MWPSQDSPKPSWLPQHPNYWRYLRPEHPVLWWCYMQQCDSQGHVRAHLLINNPLGLSFHGRGWAFFHIFFLYSSKICMGGEDGAEGRLTHVQIHRDSMFSLAKNLWASVSWGKMLAYEFPELSRGQRVQSGAMWGWCSPASPLLPSPPWRPSLQDKFPRGMAVCKHLSWFSGGESLIPFKVVVARAHG